MPSLWILLPFNPLHLWTSGKEHQLLPLLIGTQHMTVNAWTLADCHFPHMSGAD